MIIIFLPILQLSFTWINSWLCDLPLPPLSPLASEGVYNLIIQSSCELFHAHLCLIYCNWQYLGNASVWNFYLISYIPQPSEKYSIWSSPFSCFVQMMSIHGTLVALLLHAYCTDGQNMQNRECVLFTNSTNSSIWSTLAILIYCTSG